MRRNNLVPMLTCSLLILAPPPTHLALPLQLPLSSDYNLSFVSRHHSAAASGDLLWYLHFILLHCFNVPPTVEAQALLHW